MQYVHPRHHGAAVQQPAPRGPAERPGLIPAAGPDPGFATARLRRIVIVGTEAILVLALLAAWLALPALRASGSLTVLFLYSFPSEFLIGLVPHEPVLLFYGQLHDAVVVAAVASAGTVLAEALNYSFLSCFLGTWVDRRAQDAAVVARMQRLFHRAPFTAVVIAGITPIPFFPMRFLVVMEGYPLGRYLIAVFLSRTPRFLLLAAAGSFLAVPAWALLALFVVLIVPAYCSRCLSAVHAAVTALPRRTGHPHRAPSRAAPAPSAAPALQARQTTGCWETAATNSRLPRRG
jgi:membrane protein YqaA with SNARE-associated domain